MSRRTLAGALVSCPAPWAAGRAGLAASGALGPGAFALSVVNGVFTADDEDEDEETGNGPELAAAARHCLRLCADARSNCSSCQSVDAG